jgi:methionine-rich copper-binding protein CopC
MKKSTIVLTVLITVGLFLAEFGPAAAHAGLVDSEPSPGASLTSPPEVIRLTFSEPILENSTFTLMTEDFREIDAVDPSINPERPEQLYAIIPPLEPGTYTVQWKAVSEDGGETSGSYSFQIRGSNGLSLWFVGLIAFVALLVIIGLGLLIRRLQTGER